MVHSPLGLRWLWRASGKISLPFSSPDHVNIGLQVWLLNTQSVSAAHTFNGWLATSLAWLWFDRISPPLVSFLLVSHNWLEEWAQVIFMHAHTHTHTCRWLCIVRVLKELERKEEGREKERKERKKEGRVGRTDRGKMSRQGKGKESGLHVSVIPALRR